MIRNNILSQNLGPSHNETVKDLVLRDSQSLSHTRFMTESRTITLRDSQSFAIPLGVNPVVNTILVYSRQNDQLKF